MAGGRVAAFEEEVRRDTDLILREASDFFMERGSILQALKELARRLEEASIPCAVVGAIALARHGLVRMTLDIDVRLSPEGLESFKARYLGRGYVPAFPGANKTFRAADSGVRIKVITASEASVDMGGIRVLPLERLVELELASGLTAPHRRRDLADVQDLVRALRLPAEFADGLDASVQPLYRELWQEAQAVDPCEEP